MAPAASVANLNGRLKTEKHSSEASIHCKFAQNYANLPMRCAIV